MSVQSVDDYNVLQTLCFIEGVPMECESFCSSNVMKDNCDEYFNNEMYFSPPYFAARKVL